MTPDRKSQASTTTAKAASKPAAAPAHKADAKAPRLTLERTFDATPERLWTYWTDPKKYARWLSPQKADLVIHEFDVRVGGCVKFDMPLDNGQVNKEEGVFHVLDKTRHLVSGNADKTFLIDVTFTPVEGGKKTKLVAIITGVPADWHAAATQGWGVGFGKLERLLEIPGPGEGFRLVRQFAAKPERVWAMWTTKEGLAKWWKLSAEDMGYAFKVVKLDVRVGGEYDLTMTNREHGELHNHGVYTEVVPNKRLAQRWNFDIFLAPGEKPYPIHIAIDFEALPPEAGGGTKMTFTQGPMAKPEFTEGSRQGVIANFAKLEKALGR